MAKRRTMTALQRQYFAPRAPAAIVVRTRSAPAKRKRHHRRRSSSGFGFGGGGLIAHGMGGFAFGYLVKGGYIDKLPDVPVIGRTGAAAIGLNYFSKHGGGALAGNMARAAAVLAGYQLGTEGRVHG
jgi:cytochrome bd-type quinol oxidase subunit 2